MKRLWAPWRIEYILGDKDDACIFCAAAGKDPEEALVLYSGPLTIVLLNKYPYNNGHVMVAPARHAARLEDLTPEESSDMFRLLQHSTTALAGAMKPDGFNVGANLGRAAGAGIEDHLHFHVVPRWSGDSNFMPVLSDVKVMPEHLRSTFSRLAPFFSSI